MSELKETRNLFVGCSSSDNIPDKYMRDSIEYLEEVFRFAKEFNLVFGAAKSGIMGNALYAARICDKNVMGICPEAYQSDIPDLKEYYHKVNCILTKTVGERTEALFLHSDALLFLPGGIGTIYELFTAIEYKRNGELNKPIVIYNSNNYFDGLFAFLDKMYNESFTNRSVSDCYHISYSAKDTVEYLQECFDEERKDKEKIIIGFNIKSDTNVRI